MSSTPEPKPPVAKRVPRASEIHGERRVDDYAWLREKGDPDVRAYLEAENAYAEAVMKPTEAFQQALYAEMLGRIRETDEEVPYRKGGFFYYSRTEEGKQYPILCRRKGRLEAEEETTLDLNLLAEGKPFLSLGAFQVSDDGTLLAIKWPDASGEAVSLWKRLFEALYASWLPPYEASFAWAVSFVLLFYLLALWMDRRGIYLKV